MKTVTVWQIRHQFPRVLRLIQNGETVGITSHREVIATLAPPPKKVPIKRPWADLEARLQRLLAQPMMEMTGAEIISDGRGQSASELGSARI